MLTEIAKEYLIQSDPVIFAKEILFPWLGGYPDPVQSQILKSNSRQMICNNHRQWGKSSIIAIKALHRGLFSPGSLTLIASPTENQSKEMFLKVTTASIHIDKLELLEDSKSRMTLKNGSRIVTLPGTEKSVRGYTSPDLIIIDEASRALEELYIAIRPMMLMSLGQLILISTPHGKQGFFHDVWSHHEEVDANSDDMMTIEDGWERYRVRAIENERVDSEWLEAEKGQMSERAFQQEYLCEFVETEEQVFPYDLIQSMFSDEIDPLFGDIVSDEIEPMKFGGNV